MNSEKRNIERFLEVGLVAMLHTDVVRKDCPRYRTVVRGWRKGGHVLLDRPKTEAGSFAILNEGHEVSIRFVQEGRACAFRCHVIDWDSRKHNPYLRVTWPGEIQHMAFRRFERIKLELVCTAMRDRGQKLSMELRDLSMGGCGLHSMAAVDPGTVLELHCELPDGSRVEGAPCVVRSCKPCTEGHLLGCEFGKETNDALGTVVFYVAATMERSRQEGTPSTCVRILVVDGDTERQQRFRSNFERRGLETIPASNTLDAFYRLRTLLPVAVAVHEGLSDLPGLEVCRLIKTHRDFAQLPVYLYGGNAAELAVRARAAGANAYFPDAASMAPDLVFEVCGQLPRAAQSSAG